MNLKNALLAVCATGTISGVATTAYSANQAGMSGHGWPNHFDGCFGSSFATMFNNCADTVGAQRLLIIPAQIFKKDFSFTYAVSANAGGNGSNGMTNCQAISIATNGNGASFSQIVSTNTSAASQFLNLGSVNVQPSFTLHFECRIAQGGGRVTSVGVD
jgi:hypothetical protein